MKKSYLQSFVESFIRTHRRRTLPKNQVQRAIALIDVKLDNPCCDDDSVVVDLQTDGNGMFLSTFEKMLSAIPKEGNINSLQKTKKLLQKNIGIPCCD